MGGHDHERGQSRLADVSLVEQHADAGLPVPSIIRTSKIATIEARHADGIGRLSRELWGQVEAELRTHLALE